MKSVDFRVGQPAEDDTLSDCCLLMLRQAPVLARFLPSNQEMHGMVVNHKAITSWPLLTEMPVPGHKM